MVGVAGLEPAASRTPCARSSHLSYTPLFPRIVAFQEGFCKNCLVRVSGIWYFGFVMAKKLQTNVLNYRVIIEKGFYDDGTPVYSASCPTLGVFDYGDSIDEVLESIKDGIELAIECLVEEGQEVPVDHIEDSIIVNTRVPLPAKARLATI